MGPLPRSSARADGAGPPTGAVGVRGTVGGSEASPTSDRDAAVSRWGPANLAGWSAGSGAVPGLSGRGAPRTHRPP